MLLGGVTIKDKPNNGQNKCKYCVKIKDKIKGFIADNFIWNWPTYYGSYLKNVAIKFDPINQYQIN